MLMKDLKVAVIKSKPGRNGKEQKDIDLLNRAEQGAWSHAYHHFFFFCIPQLYLSGSPLLGEIFAYVTVF